MRRAPTRFAPICARRSPPVSCGARTFLQNEAQYVLVDFATPHDFCGRYDDAFLIDFTYLRPGCTACFHPRPRGGPCWRRLPEPVLTGINRRDEGDVVEVAASTMWIVKDDAVPGREIPGAVFPQRVWYSGLQGREMRWLRKGLRDNPE